jgi:hypothetical protein
VSMFNVFFRVLRVFSKANHILRLTGVNAKRERWKGVRCEGEGEGGRGCGRID